MILSEISPKSLPGFSSPAWSNFGKAFLLNKVLFQAGRLTVTGLRKTLLQSFSFKYLLFFIFHY